MKSTSGSSGSTSILSSPEFLKLLKNRRCVSLALSAVMMGAYFTFVLILALKKNFFADSSIANIPTGIFFGVGLILLAWLLTGIYVAWANTSYDVQVASLKQQVSGESKKGK